MAYLPGGLDIGTYIHNTSIVDATEVLVLSGMWRISACNIGGLFCVQIAAGCSVCVCVCVRTPVGVIE